MVSLVGAEIGKRHTHTREAHPDVYREAKTQNIMAAFVLDAHTLKASVYLSCSLYVEER